MLVTSAQESDRPRATYAGPVPLRIPNLHAAGRPRRILFLGDTAFGEQYHAERKAKGGRSILEDQGYDYSLANFRDVLLAADLVVANLETPVTDIGRSPFAGRKPFVHWGDIEHTPACLARHNITTVSLANNHTFDYGAAGFDQTLQVLGAAGFSMFGAGCNLEASAHPLLIDSGDGKIAVFGAFERRLDYQHRYAVYAEQDRGGLCPLDHQLLATAIRSVKRTHPGIFVVLFPHWGQNYRLRTDQQALDARALADAGADLVLGHGAHAVQEIERIGTTWVVYSLGNFVFNSAGRYKKFNAPPVGLVAELVIGAKTADGALKFRLFPIVTNNEVTRFQSRFVSESEFRSTLELLKRISRNPADLVGSSRIGREDGRFYVEFVAK